MNKNKLTFIALNHQTSIWPLCMLAEILMYYFYKLAGINHGGYLIGEWRNRINRWAVDIEKYDVKIAELMLKKAVKNKKWVRQIAKKIPAASRRLTRFTQKIFNSDLAKKTNDELYEFYTEYREEFIDMYLYAWFPNALEGKKNIFTSKLENYLKIKLKKIGQEERAGEYLSILTTPTKLTNREKEEIDFIRILFAVKKAGAEKFFKNKYVNSIENRLPQVWPKINKLIMKHHKKYCWLPFDYDGPAWSKKYFLEKIKKSIQKKTKLKEKLSAIKKEKEQLKKLQKKIARKIGLDKDGEYKFLFALARELLYLKDYRKDALFKSYYHMDKLIREIGRRLSLSVVQVKHILPSEMENVLLKRKFSIREINKRIKYSALLYQPVRAGQFPKQGVKIYTGNQAKSLVKRMVEEKNYDSTIKEIKGHTAYLGKAQGEAKLVFSPSDITKMKKGDILISPSTNPNLLPAMRLAGAIVTDRGGITCHAAITSRELKIPCVIGTEIATKILRDKQMVEVDADHGLVKIIK